MTTTTRPRKLPIRVTHPDKVYWPDEGYTKLDLIEFYNSVYYKLGPFMRDRILVLERCPEGIRKKCFYQKEKPSGLPEDTPTKRIVHTGDSGATNYVVGGLRKTQLALANLGAIAVHVWGTRASHPRQPDWVCFDLDPSSSNFADAVRAGFYVKELLDELNLRSYPKTSGGKGLHIFVPIRVGPDVDDVLHFAQAVCATAAKRYPRELTTEMSKRARRGRTYLDALRNAFGQTVVAPYSVRWRVHAPVSTPLDWSEVKVGLDPANFNIGNFAKRLRRRDPWADFFQRRQSLAGALDTFR